MIAGDGVSGVPSAWEQHVDAGTFSVLVVSPDRRRMVFRLDGSLGQCTWGWAVFDEPPALFEEAAPAVESGEGCMSKTGFKTSAGAYSAMIDAAYPR